MNRIRCFAAGLAAAGAVLLTGCVAPGYYYNGSGYSYYGYPAVSTTVAVGGGYWGGWPGYWGGWYGRPAYYGGWYGRPGYPGYWNGHPGYGGWNGHPPGAWGGRPPGPGFAAVGTGGHGFR